MNVHHKRTTKSKHSYGKKSIFACNFVLKYSINSIFVLHSLTRTVAFMSTNEFIGMTDGVGKG